MANTNRADNNYEYTEPASRESLEYLELRVQLLEQAMAEFVQRVEDGEIRSSQTYRKFKAILAA